MNWDEKGQFFYYFRRHSAYKVSLANQHHHGFLEILRNLSEDNGREGTQKF